MPWPLLAKVAGQLNRSEADIMRACGVAETKAGQVSRAKATATNGGGASTPPPATIIHALKKAVIDAERACVGRCWELKRDEDRALWAHAQGLAAVAKMIRTRRDGKRAA